MKTNRLGVTKRLGATLGLIFLAIMIGNTACDELITNEITVEVAGHPTAEFSIDCPIGQVCDSGCAPFTVNFLDSSNGPHHKWLWRFGDGDTSILEDPTHIYDSAGTYEVSLLITDTVLDGFGSDFEVKSRFIVVGTSNSGFTADSVKGCPGLLATFTPATAGGSAWLWDFGDGASSTEESPSHFYDSIGVYDVSLRVTGGCGTVVDTVFGFIEIVECPVIAITNETTSQCAPVNIVFRDSSTISNPSLLTGWSWDFGNGETATTPDFTANYTTAGQYWAKLTVTTSEGGSSTDSVMITIFDPPQAQFVVSDSFRCEAKFQQFAVQFTNQSLGDLFNYRWDFGDGFVSTEENPQHAYTTPGIYTVTLQVDGHCDPLGADSIMAQTIKTNLIQLADSIWTDSVSFSKDSLSAVPDTSFYTFTDKTNGYVTSRLWTMDDSITLGTGSAITNVAITPAGTRIITLTVRNECMSDSVVYIDSVVVAP